VLWYATPHVTDADHRARLCRILNRDARPMWAPRDWVWEALRRDYSACHVTAYLSAMYFSKYCDDDWLLVLPRQVIRSHAL
jgi:hypothetical protein